MNRWPFPGDSPLVRARKVALAYRAALAVTDPEACVRLDTLLGGYGETWAVPRVQRYELDDWLDVADAADLASVDPAQLRVWRRRGLLVGRKVGMKWEYQAREILAMSTRLRRRGAKDGG